MPEQWGRVIWIWGLEVTLGVWPTGPHNVFITSISYKQNGKNKIREGDERGPETREDLRLSRGTSTHPVLAPSEQASAPKSRPHPTLDIELVSQPGLLPSGARAKHRTARSPPHT